MLSTPDADNAWKGMARAIPSLEPPRREAGKAAYAALLQGEGGHPGHGAAAEQWLLLRERTSRRLSDAP
ncbi:hypothetical protein [Streptomyces sp. NPDC059378]|uniref:hypothetical protein n=1 Tax=Streptomyces sp. NPDC059378 TaxID=3346815 RepID=UPI0036A5EF99